VIEFRVQYLFVYFQNLQSKIDKVKGSEAIREWADISYSSYEDAGMEFMFSNSRWLKLKWFLDHYQIKTQIGPLLSDPSFVCTFKPECLFSLTHRCVCTFKPECLFSLTHWCVCTFKPECLFSLTHQCVCTFKPECLFSLTHRFVCTFKPECLFSLTHRCVCTFKPECLSLSDPSRCMYI